jgi:hypothetical protein
MAKTPSSKSTAPTVVAKPAVNTPPKARVGKLPKKNNPRLPRRQKKAKQKADAAKAAL